MKTNEQILAEGGPAFPHVPGNGEYFGGKLKEWGGLTVRDWFAGQAISGTLPGSKMDDNDVAHLARWAYRMADAMLAERNKNSS